MLISLDQIYLHYLDILFTLHHPSYLNDNPDEEIINVACG